MSAALRDSVRDTADLVIDSVDAVFEGRSAQPVLAAPEPLDQRLAELTDLARKLLSAGVILGRPFTVHEVAGLLSVPPMHLLAAVEETLAHGLLVERGDELAFASALLGEAVYDALPQPVRLAMHREAARALEEEGRPPAEVAEQLVRGWQRSERVPGRLLDVLREHRGQLSTLLVEVVRLLSVADRVEEARDLVDRVMDADIDPFRLVSVVIALSETTRCPGHAERVAERARRALERPGLAPEVRSRLLVARAVGLSYLDDDLAAEQAAAASVSASEEVARGPATVLEDACTAGGDEVRVVAALTQSLIARRRGALQDAVAHAQRAVLTVRSTGAWSRVLHPELWLAHARAAGDELDEAHVLLDIGQRDAERWATSWPSPIWHHARATLYLAAGRLVEAEGEAHRALWLVSTGGSPYIRLNALLGEVALLRGEVTAARTYVCRARQMVGLGHCAVDHEDLLWRMGLLQAAEGEVGDALATWAPLYDALAHRREMLTRQPRAAAELVRVAVRAGDPTRAKAVVSAARDLARRNPTVPSLRGAAEHAFGVLTDSRSALRAAVRAYRGSPRELDRAAALEDAGRAEQAAGASRVAVRYLTEAEHCYRSAGAESAARRALCALEEARSKRRGAGSDPAVTGWESLTEAELRVVRVVAEGLTNKQAADRLFLSPHTVDSHLRHSFAKLGINNRVELACAVMRERSKSHPENA